MSRSGASTTTAATPIVGVACAALSAFAYGVTVPVGRALAQAGFGSAVSLGIRFGMAAVMLFALLVASRRPLLPAPGERVRAFLLGAVGYAVESSFFFLALARGSAAAVTLLFYAYPAIVTALELPFTRRRPDRRVLGALALAGAGVVLITVAGKRVAITPTGIVLALASAVAISVYVLAAERSMRRTDSLTAAAWVAAGASVALLGEAGLGANLRIPPGYRPQIALYGLATAVAFVMLFAALRRIGSSRTSVVMTLEAVFAIILAAVFLHEAIGAVQLVGGGAVLGAAVIIALTPGGNPAHEVPRVG